MRSNKYPGKCEKCGGNVARRAGVIVKQDGRWLVYHANCYGEATDSCTVCGGAGQLHGGRNCPTCDGTGSGKIQQYAHTRAAEQKAREDDCEATRQLCEAQAEAEYNRW